MGLLRGKKRVHYQRNGTIELPVSTRNAAFQDNWQTMQHLGFLWIWMVRVGKIPKWEEIISLPIRTTRAMPRTCQACRQRHEPTYNQRYGDVFPLRTIQRLKPAEINGSVEDEKVKWFNLIIRAKFGDSLWPPTPISEEPSKYNDIEEPSKIPEADDFADSDLYIDSEVLLPQNGEHMR